MKQTVSGLGGALRDEIRVFRLAAVVSLGALYCYTWLTTQPPLSRTALALYALLSLALIGIYLLPLLAPIGAETASRIAPFILLEALAAFVIAILFRGQAMFYLYLAAFNGYSGLRFAAKHWLLPLLYLVGFLALAFLLYTNFDKQAVIWNSLPLFFLLAFAAEFINRQWEHRIELNRLVIELSQAHQQLQDYINQAESLAILQERSRLAYELHDTLGCSLTALDVQLELLARLPVELMEERQQAAEQARRLVKDSLADLRRAVKALRPAEIDMLSLPEAIEQLVQAFEQQQSIPVSYSLEGTVYPLPSHYRLLLFRAAQESLTNIQRHAPTTPGIRLALAFALHGIMLTVENGPPVAYSQEKIEQGGYGLSGLAERARALRGQFEAGATESGGFRLQISLPVSPMD
ncbi:MAG: sensor histidine kinase [Chloroflexota bacterium]